MKRGLLQWLEWRKWWRDQGKAEARRVLMIEWDPIGVADLLEEGEPWGRDEYDSYLGRLALMLRQGVNADAIASYLARIRTGPMGLPPDAETDARVARRLMEIALERPDSIA